MPNLPAGPRQVFRDHPGYGRALAINIALFAFLGLALLLSDSLRFGAPAYGPLRTTGAAWGADGLIVWGAIMVGAAVMLALAPLGGTRAARWAMTVGSFLHLILAIFFATAALNDPRASFWGGGWFLAMAVWLASQSIAQRELRAEPSTPV